VYSFSEDESIGQRVETVARDFPMNLAVRAHGVSINYRDFNGVANAIARIVAANTKAGDRVVLYMDQGTRLLAAIVGVLKAGRVYVPLDPAYPSARNALIASNADTALILTDSPCESKAAETAAGTCPIVNLDRERLDPATENIDYNVSAAAAACLIYTSGSTGRPKGVIHTHQSLLHIARRRQQVQEITPADRLTLLYSSSVMGAVYGTFVALTSGASLFPNSLREMSIPALVQWLRDERITVYHSVPTVFRAICGQFGEGTAFPDIRLVIFGGERTLRSDLDRVFRWFRPDCRAFCGLGMSEAGTVRAWLLDRDVLFEGESVPSGYSVEGVETAIVREDGTPAAPDEIGEVTVQSRYLFSGYWRDEEATAKVLSESPNVPGLWTYRTGDLGRIAPDGQLYFCGRRDGQLSIRGFRVETGEIESILMRHPSVRDAAVTILQPESEAPLLAAFYVARDENINDLRVHRHIASHLPRHMVPSRFRKLDALPTTPNGKIDRRALEQLEAFPAAAETEFQAPETPLEIALHGLFSSALPGATLGVHTSFFEAGGTSLAAIQLLLEIERTQGKRVRLTGFFAQPTIAGVVTALATDEGACAVVVLPLRASGTKPPLYFMLGGDIYRPLVERLDPDIPAYTVMLEWESDILLGGKEQAIARETMTLTKLAHLQAEAVSAFQPTGPLYLAGLSFGGKMAFEVARELRARGREIHFLALFDPSLLFPSRRYNVAWLRHQVGLFYRMGLRRSLQRIHRSVWPRVRRKLAPLRMRAMSPSDLSETPDLRMLERARLKVYFDLSRRHEWNPYEGSAVLYRARDSTHALIRGIDPTQGWGTLVKGGLTIEDIPGDHTGILEEPNVAELAEKMNTHLIEAFGIAVLAGRALSTDAHAGEQAVLYSACASSEPLRPRQEVPDI